jgi:hypothetical protein
MLFSKTRVDGRKEKVLTGADSEGRAVGEKMNISK